MNIVHTYTKAVIKERKITYNNVNYCLQVDQTIEEIKRRLEAQYEETNDHLQNKVNVTMFCYYYYYY